MASSRMKALADPLWHLRSTLCHVVGLSRDGREAGTAPGPSEAAYRDSRRDSSIANANGPHTFAPRTALISKPALFRKRRAGITFEGTLLVERQVRGYPANGCGRTEDEPLHVRPLHGQHEPHHSQDVVLVIRHGPNFGIAHPPSTPQGERSPSLTEHVVDGLFIPDVGVPKDERPPADGWTRSRDALLLLEDCRLRRRRAKRSVTRPDWDPM